MKKVKAKDLKPGMVVVGMDGNPTAWEPAPHVVKSVKRHGRDRVELLAQSGAHDDNIDPNKVYLVR